ncbi:MAG: DUF3800 domain-containing protein [Alphaproteobacteria bacterium]
MPTTTLFMDESGFTGPDLLNPDQPIFAVASTSLSNDDAEAILRDSFPRFQGNEFKFGRIWARSTNRQGLIRFAQAVGQSAASVFVYYIDKRFCALTKFVDFLIEPVLHTQGYDFYADGYARRFCNHLKFGLDHFCLPSLYSSTLEAYQAFALDPGENSLATLQNVLRIRAGSVPLEVRDLFELAAIGADKFHEFHDFGVFSGSNEIQLTSVLASIGQWRLRLPDDFDLVHDESSNFFRQADIWSAITNPDVPTQLHPRADGESIPFPLRVNRTVPGRSHDNASIQFCDIVAGLICRLRGPIRGGETEAAFRTQLLEAGFGSLEADGIRPELEIIDGPPARLNGPDAVDQMSMIIGRLPIARR